MSHKGEEWRLCLEYLPKPRKRHHGLVSICSDCGQLFYGNANGGWFVSWTPLKQEQYFHVKDEWTE